MAPPASDQDTSSQGDTPEMSLTTSASKASQTNQTNNLTIFHYYIHLPFELRAQIRTMAIKSAYPNSDPSKRPDGAKPCSRLATVSKEWQDDVERALFGQVRIDPCNEGDVGKFKELFTDERKRFLMRLDIAIDDDKGTSPWHQRMGLLRISQVMGQIGQFFHYINGWDLCREGKKQQSLKVVFTTSHQTPGCHPPMDEPSQISIGSLWEKKDLDRLTNRGLITTDIALWAIKSEFPSFLNMVTHLTFFPDCLPLSAAQKIISTMPNLETCVLEVSFKSKSEDGWRNFTNFIGQLRSSAPSLRELILHNQDCSSQTFVPPSKRIFAAALRDFSQGLEVLRAELWNLHPAFFLQSSEELDPAVATSQWRWPRLQHLELRSFSGEHDSDSTQPTLSTAEMLIAAGRTAMAMPILESAIIDAGPGNLFVVKRKLSDGARNIKKADLGLCGFDESEDNRILSAWAPFLGGEAKFFKKQTYETPPSLRIYKTVAKDEAGSRV